MLLVAKNLSANAGDIRDVSYMGSIPGSGRVPGRGHATHSSILARRTPWTRGAWWASHWAVQSWIQLKQVNIECTELYLCITKVNTISILKK